VDDGPLTNSDVRNAVPTNSQSPYLSSHAYQAGGQNPYFSPSSHKPNLHNPNNHLNSSNSGSSGGSAGVSSSSSSSSNSNANDDRESVTSIPAYNPLLHRYQHTAERPWYVSIWAGTITFQQLFTLDDAEDEQMQTTFQIDSSIGKPSDFDSLHGIVRLYFQKI